MTRSLRTASVALAAVAGLALSSPALAKLTPTFVVNHTPHTTTPATVAMKIALDPTDDPVLRLTFVVPAGYSAVSGQAAGTKIGTVRTHIIAKAVSPTAVLPVNGEIVTDDPAKYQANLQTLGCTGSFQHQAVWLLNLSAAGRQLAVPLYVDPAPAREQSFASHIIQACLQSPDIPESQGGAAQGVKIVDATLMLDGIFSVNGPGQFVWGVYVTPYRPGTATPNRDGTAQALGITRLNAAVSARATKGGRFLASVSKTKAKKFTVRGAVTENGAGIAGARIELWMGRTAKTLKRVARLSSRAGGAYSRAVAVRGKTLVQARASVPQRSLGAAGCSLGSSFPPAPAGCASATASAFTATSRTLTLR